ncbi:MAG: F0F1 ATP synthase subunit gamma, partial [Candidatus Magasanikbacteria bacterium]|jgi:F-type H+-transporting ATPase subunit gamma
VLGIGKKGAEFSKKMKYNLIASYTDLSDTPKLNDIMPVATTAIADYEAGKYDKVVVAYTDFKSAISQVAKLRQVLPVSEMDLEKMMSDEGVRNTEQGVSEPKVELSDYLFEPNRTEVLKIILPRLVETQIYQSLLESAASEHSSRMMAMRNASDAATEMIGELTMEFNKARQSKITQEIAEIVGGAAALE